jgi:hypothetical protein
VLSKYCQSLYVLLCAEGTGVSLDPSCSSYCTLLVQISESSTVESPVTMASCHFLHVQSVCPSVTFPLYLCLPLPKSSIVLYMKITSCMLLLLCSFHKIQWTLQHPSRRLLRVCMETQMCLVTSLVLVSAPRSESKMFAARKINVQGETD